MVTGAVAVLAGIGWLLPPRARRSPAPVDPDADTEVIPTPAERRRRRRTAVVLAMLWALGILLPFGQLLLSGEEQRAQAQAARAAVQLTSEIAVGLSRTAFATTAGLEADRANRAAQARAGAARNADLFGGIAERTLAQAEATAAVRAAGIAERMARPPGAADGLGPALTRALGAKPNDWYRLLAAQQAEADRANGFGDRANLAVVLIAVWRSRPAWSRH